MTGVRRSLRYTKPDAAIEALSAESQSTQEGGPPGRAEKTSSVGDTRKDEEADDSGEAESDSGDSLFITQKPVPEAVRSVERRQRCSRLRSDPSSPPDVDESANDSSSSDSPEEAKRKRPSRKTTKLPKFNFPFLKLTGRQAGAKKGFLTAGQNITLHTHVMGCFFLNVRELLEGHQQGSLPTVDKEGEDISPLSEEEETGSESEDMKVVDRKRFVGRSKCSQPWCMKSSNSSQEGQKKKIDEAPAKASTSRVPALSSDTVLETETGNKHATSDGNTVAQSETSRTNGQFTNGNENIVLQEKENEKELCEDSDATVCEALEMGSPQAQEHPEEHMLNGRDASPLRTEPQADVFHTDNLLQTGQEEDIPDSQTLLHSLPDLITDSNYGLHTEHTEPRVKKKRKKKAKGVHEGVEGEKNQSREEPKGQHTAVPVSLETEEIPSLSEDNPAEPPAPQTSDEPEPNEENSSHDDIALREGERHSPDSKQIKKKRKKRSAADNGGQEQDGNVETDVRLESDSLLPVICDVVNDNKEEERKKKKKKKRERNAESEEGIEQLPLNTVAEAASDDVETQGKKKKRKKEKMVVNMGEPEEAVNMTSDRPLTSEGQLEATGERLENDKKRKKKKKQMSGPNDDVRVGGEDGADLGSPNDVNLEESTEQSMKKKKESIPEEDISSTPDKSKKVNGAGDSQTTEEGPNGQDAEVVSKEKKKKKSEIFSRKVSEDALTQIDDSVSVRKKKKKRTPSFLIADAEEKDAQMQDKQSSTSVAAHVWDAQKPIVSAGYVETESAQITGNVEASNDGSRKKKRKREMSVAQESTEQDHEQDFKKPKEICVSCLPETTDTGVKKKKKRKRSDSRSVTSIETFISSSEAGYPTDEAVTLKKKKKKKKKKETEQSPAAAVDDAESEEAVQRSWSSHSQEGNKQSIFTPPSPEAKDVKEKKKKKKVKSTDDVLLESEPSSECAKIKTHKTEKKKRNKLTSSPSVRSSSKEDVSECVSKNKSKKAKRKLYNPDVGFLSLLGDGPGEKFSADSTQHTKSLLQI